MNGTDWGKLSGIFIMIVSFFGGALKYGQWWLANNLEKAKVKKDEVIELADREFKKIQYEYTSQIELAKYNALTTKQVAEILSDYKEISEGLTDVREDLQNIKTASDSKVEMMVQKIDELRTMVRDHNSTLLSFSARGFYGVKKQND